MAFLLADDGARKEAPCTRHNKPYLMGADPNNIRGFSVPLCQRLHAGPVTDA